MADPFIGQIVMFGGTFAPTGWAFCDGQILPIASNTALFSILGTTYGGDGSNTFALPDLRGRFPMHVGASTGPGLSSRALGQKGGSESQTLTVGQLPSHNHTFQASKVAGTSLNPNGNTLGFNANFDKTFVPLDASKLGPMASQVIGDTGSGQSFQVQNPFTCVNFIIALLGVFPSET